MAGVTFGYFVVLPAAVRFFQNFNSGEFNVLVQASQYYHFAAVILLAMGLVFQVPVGVLAATRAGIVTTKQLRHNRRYAILACGAVAAFLPGDAITLLLETVPLYLLFELSVLIARIIEYRDDAAAGARCPVTGAIDRASAAALAATCDGVVIQKRLHAVRMGGMFNPLRSGGGSGSTSACGCSRTRSSCSSCTGARRTRSR